ncbi:MAG: ArnT family glycosyltransferase [Steroidobacteraceae bacterium]
MKRDLPWSAMPWLVLPVVAFVAVVFRQPLAIDETRYLAVAWDMFREGQWLVPHLNGETYAHKPPLLFWLLMIGWKVLGVGDAWTRILPVLLSGLSLLLVYRLAGRLWPGVEGVGRFSAVIVGGTLWWAAFQNLVMFDLLLTCCVLVSLNGLADAQDPQAGWRPWAWVSAGIGLSILAKGPVALLHILPLALAAPWWSEAARRQGGGWYLRLLGAVAVGLAIALAWVIPAVLVGGDAYAHNLLWDQTAHRVTTSFAHQRPWWWYLPLLPALGLPWFIWPPAWRAAREALAMPGGARFCLAWALPAFLAFCAVSGKQPHYLLPLLPAPALLVARGLATSQRMSYRRDRLLVVMPAALLAAVASLELALNYWPMGTGGTVLEEWAVWFEEIHPGWIAALWALIGWAALPFRRPLIEGAARLQAAMMVSLAIIAAAGTSTPAGRAYAVAGMAAEIAALQQAGRSIAYWGQYHGQLQYVGRLRQPLRELWDAGELQAFAREQPEGLVLVDSRENPLTAGVGVPFMVVPYRTGFWSLWTPARLAESPELLNRIAARRPHRSIE